MKLHQEGTTENLKEVWSIKYRTAADQLRRMKDVNGLISAFNANVDAVIKISGQKIMELISQNGMDQSKLLQAGERSIKTKPDVMRGLIHCFKSGIAEEWLIEDEEVFSWLNDSIGYDKLQMGGQGGIVANVMAVCGVNPVYVHCASLPAKQAGLFLDLNNLQTVDQDGKLQKACSIDRKGDIPLIHWIIEFDKGDVLECAGVSYTCPKSNRFIATYDPLNFKLHIDEGFTRSIDIESNDVEIIILSGYQMLKESLADGEKGSDRIDYSIKTIEKWQSDKQGQLIHLEMASTQDKIMRKYLLDTLAQRVDSLGFNERELIDLLEVIGEDDLAGRCEEDTCSANLYEGMLKVYAYTGVPRMQLHMFGLYLTMQKPEFIISPEKNRDGMQLAAVIAASKAGTGSINSSEVLLWAKDKAVSDTGLSELKSLSDHIGKNSDNQLITEGIFRSPDFDLIAVPTILIDKPVTLVGMGDTISSISLVAAR